MFEVVFLGTAAGVPSVERGLPALIVLHGGRRFLVDCGEGTQRQLLKSGLGLRGLDCVLLTHAHVDHLLGFGGLVATLALLEAGRGLTVYGGASALGAVRSLLSRVIWPAGRPPFEVRCEPVEPGAIIEDERLRVHAFPVSHRGADSFGFVFAEQLRPWVQPGDMVIAISGSGNSPNVLRAVQVARELGAYVLGLAGFGGGKLAEMADECVVVPCNNMQRVEDCHMVIGHLLFWRMMGRIEERQHAAALVS